MNGDVKTKVGFLGLGVMGLPMSENVIRKSGCEVYGYDVVSEKLEAFSKAGGHAAASAEEVYTTCDIIMQMLPTHAIIINSVEQAVKYGKKGNIIIDLSSAAPHIILELYPKVKEAGMYLLDSPVSGGNPKAKDGTLAIMTGGDKDIFEKVKPLLACMGEPVYTAHGSRYLFCPSLQSGSRGQWRKLPVHERCRLELFRPECTGNHQGNKIESLIRQSPFLY